MSKKDKKEGGSKMNKKYQEVEAKYRLLNVEDVIVRIKELNISKVGESEYQKDIYYTSPFRDFLENEIVSEWLRIRETKDVCTMNYKLWLPIGAKIQNQCKEFETEISDSYAMEQILSHLSFKEVAVVEKERKSWKYEKVEISIDEVSELGSFIELEYDEEVDESEIDGINKLFKEILSVLNAKVSERDRRGYAYAIIQKKKERLS